MWIKWSVIALTIGAIVAGAAPLAPYWRRAPWGWRMLGLSGLPLAVNGLIFVIRFWDPTRGPYLVNEIYPFGAYVNAWAVSFGFMWLAFGLAFFALALSGPRSARTWLGLLVSWTIAWLPHGLIVLGFVVAGSNEPNLRSYGEWRATSAGFVTLTINSLALLTHVVLSAVGFVQTGRELRRWAGTGKDGYIE